ncbi:hypothetical protein AM629_16295 [Photorhabdus heterorhabditis]|uniref:Glycosyl transferase family 1 domain-containing protein n=1 Tax=Photorhabdus heterorhabditis TaxID=880156 RepID=A0ABR5K978_9GAMM|nr:glycosyltransferase [Photorhabdus heterorhabditis]KOY60969.1 hypothetical protein AM629_16295 [Photorhabdus heterorhabditis]
MSMRKIFIIGYELGGFGGMETVCKKFVEILTKYDNSINIEFIFFKEGNKNVNDDWLDGMKFRRVPSEISHTKIRRVHYALQFAKIIIKEQPDIVISFDTVCCYIADLSRKFSFKKFKIYSWIHFPIHNLYKSIYLLKADYHLSIGAGVTAQLIDIGVDEKKIFTIYNPVDKTNDLISRGNDTRLLYIGRILADEPKNIRELLVALSKIRGTWKLDIIGDGQDVDILKELSVKLNINDNIIWHGWQSNAWEYIKKNINSVTALVLTSTYEGFPMVLCEALSHGVFCISSNCQTGPADIIRHGINGILYPVNDTDSLVNSLQKIVNREPLPNVENIKKSINLLYADKYLSRVLIALAI